jgi:YHS domain-containing protein
LIVLLLALAVTGRAFAQQPQRERVFRADAVALIDQGKEIEGSVDFQQSHGRYLYLFSTAENRDKFKADPAKYEIQCGGACARMGPLSGEGSTKIFAVHDGRLYLFASEQCKRTFIASPEKFIERDDPKPEVSDESQRRARVLLDHVRAHSGMLSKSREIKTLRERLTRAEESGGTVHSVTDTVTILLPDGVRHDTCWGSDCWSSVVRGSEGWSIDSKGAQPLEDSQRKALMREAGRHPLMLIAQRDKPGFVVSQGERRMLQIKGEGEVEIATAVIYWDGAVTTIGVDAPGRVRLVAYCGRGPDLTIGDIEKIYSQFHNVEGRELRGRVEVTFNGKPVPSLSGVYSDQVANSPVDLAVFEKPDAIAQ